MRPRTLDHYRRAFVHKSILRNVKKSNDSTKIQSYMKQSNERLEFLGDSVFGSTIAYYLFIKYPEANEGFMTRLKTRIVRRETCAMFGRQLELFNYIFTSETVKIDKHSDKILEDTFEAFIGAIKLDLGDKFAQAFIIRLVEKYIDFNDLLEDTNYKDVLLRYTQKKEIEQPIYEEMSKDGPAHRCKFTITVKIQFNENTKPFVQHGIASSKKHAEQKAAKRIVEKLKEDKLMIDVLNRDKNTGDIINNVGEKFKRLKT